MIYLTNDDVRKINKGDNMIKRFFKAIATFVRLLNEIEQEVIDSQRPSLKPKKTKSERAKEQMRDSYGRFTTSCFSVYRK